MLSDPFGFVPLLFNSVMDIETWDIGNNERKHPEIVVGLQTFSITIVVKERSANTYALIPP
jgi:hypothetical protein